MKNIQDLKLNINTKTKTIFPDIPAKRYFTIGETSKLCLLKPHVLRYWEQEFLQLKPAKRTGNRRYYQHKDILLIRQIRYFLYEQGFTIDGARARLANTTDMKSAPGHSNEMLRDLVNSLEQILRELK